MTKFLNNIEPNTKIRFSKLENKISTYEKELSKVDYLAYVKQKQKKFLSEVKKLIKLMNKNDYDKIKKFLKRTKYLFRGFNGIRAIYFIGKKN